jgi:hypothetical protein
VGGVISQKGEIIRGAIVLGSESIAIAKAGSGTVARITVTFKGSLLVYLRLLQASTSNIMHILHIADCWVFVKAEPLLFGQRRHSGWSTMYRPWQCMYLGGY